MDGTVNVARTRSSHRRQCDIRPTSMQKSCPVDTVLTRYRRQVQPRVPDTVGVVTCADLRGRRHRAPVAVGRRQVDGVAVVSTQSRP